MEGAGCWMDGCLLGQYQVYPISTELPSSTTQGPIRVASLEQGQGKARNNACK